MSGRVVIDPYAYYHSENKPVPELVSLENEEEVAKKSPVEEESSGSKDEMAATIVNLQTSDRVDDSSLPELSDEHLLLTTPWLIAFDIKAKDWKAWSMAEKRLVVKNRMP